MNNYGIDFRMPTHHAVLHTMVTAETREQAEEILLKDRPNIQIVGAKPHQPFTLADQLDDLSHQMLATANRMEDEAKGDSEIVQHSKELLGAATSVRTWIDGLREKETKE